jgi:glucokinase
VKNVEGAPALVIAVAMENDGDCFTLGEWRYGVAKGCHDVLGITLGTGIGGGFVADGRIFRGGMGFSIEPGHTKVNYTLDTPICGCGKSNASESIRAIDITFISRRDATHL